MASLRVNNVVGFGSTDAGVNFTGPIKLNTQGYMYFPTGDTSQRGRGRAVLVVVRLRVLIKQLIMFTYLQVEMP